MKKIVRVVCIGVLSGLAFLAACCTQNGLTRRERKQLTKEREEVLWKLTRCQGMERKYGPVDEFMSLKSTMLSLENRLDTINFRLGDSIDLDRSLRRRQLQYRIDSLNFLINNYTPACIYGGPDQMGSGRIKTYPELDEYNEELRKVQAELDALDRGEDPQPSEPQPAVDPRKDNLVAPLYGPPVPPRK